jgi:hypothetical protein
LIIAPISTSCLIFGIYKQTIGMDRKEEPTDQELMDIADRLLRDLDADYEHVQQFTIQEPEPKQ